MALSLKTAHCVTIHKVQGQTLQKACIDLGNTVFQGGMAYVALSRLSSMEGLYISELNAERIYPPKGISDAMQKMKTVILQC